MLDDRADPARHVGNEPRDIEQTQHDDDHLHERRNGHRPHAAEQRVNEHDARADDHACFPGNRALGKDVEDEAERGDLRRHPPEIGKGDADAHHQFHRAVVAPAVEVPDREEIHPVERAREEQPDQDEAQRGAERVGHEAAQPFAQECRGDAEHGLGAEPRGEHGGEHHVERQVPAGCNVVARVVHLRGGDQPQRDRQHEIGDDEPKHHGASRSRSARFAKRRTLYGACMARRVSRSAESRWESARAAP